MFITSCAGYDHSGFREIISVFPFRRPVLKQLRYFQSVVKNNSFSEDSCAAFRMQSNLALSTEPAPGTKEIFIRTRL